MADVRVETKYGTLGGSESDGILSFKGIPYARPPVGKLRFQTPERPLPWAGVRDATKLGNASPQPTMGAMANIPGFTARSVCCSVQTHVQCCLPALPAGPLRLVRTPPVHSPRAPG